MTFTQRRKIVGGEARLRVTRVHTLSLSLARTSFVESLMSGGTERRQCETCCENRPFFLSLSLSRVFLLAFTSSSSFVSFHNFVSSNARQITAATFLSRPWGTLPTLRYYNETRSRIRKMYPNFCRCTFSLFPFSMNSAGYGIFLASFFIRANFTSSSQDIGG